ncbi:hypothetical protein [Legionella clemsonensis]|uniref:Bacteriocin n=1 Tax=Legionella clemsonensis TaxID=1867846 RepID=A0A222P4B8_9GAMM|nr:hypothetical protein [Legionella clemsonensis]ASQ46686.1 hypothetical protein clem_10700 [Legionella clemsonensis]
MKKSLKSKNKLSKKHLNKISGGEGGIDVIRVPVDQNTKKPHGGFEEIPPANTYPKPR